MRLDVDRDQFRECIAARQYRLGRGALKSLPFSWGDLDEILYAADPAPGLLRIFDSSPVTPEQYVEEYIEVGLRKRRIKRETFYALLARGASVVLNRLESRSSIVKNLCMCVAHLAGHQTSANGYLAFGGAGTFGKHWDTHDVMVAQLLGRKRWRVFEPTFDDPLSVQTSKDHKHECPIDPVLDTTLSAGDVLYIPRGWWHEALPIDGEGTFHLAVGIHAPVVLDYLIWLCSNVIAGDEAFRRTVSLYGRQEAMLNVAAERLTGAILSSDNLEKYCHRLVQKERTASRFNLALLTGNATIADDRDLCLNSTYAGGSSISAVINGNAVSVEGVRQQILRMLMAKPMTSAREIYDACASFSREFVSTAITQMVLADIVELR